MNTLLNKLLRRTDAPIADNKLDEILYVLASTRRRHIIDYLYSERTATLSQLSQHVADAENDGPVSANERNRVWTALYQSHLPTLEEAGLVRRSDDTVIATADLNRARDAATALANSYRRA